MGAWAKELTPPPYPNLGYPISGALSEAASLAGVVRRAGPSAAGAPLARSRASWSRASSAAASGGRCWRASPSAVKGHALPSQTRMARVSDPVVSLSCNDRAAEKVGLISERHADERLTCGRREQSDAHPTIGGLAIYGQVLPGGVPTRNTPQVLLAGASTPPLPNGGAGAIRGGMYYGP